MEIFDAIRNRRSVRNFTGEPVPCEHLEAIVDAGRLAASGMNRQPWEFIVITDPGIITQLCNPSDHWLSRAGACIAVVVDPETRWWVEDASAATQNMLLACHALGYGACWIEGYTIRHAELIRNVLGIPENRKLFTLIPVGVPVERPTKEKKALGEVIHWQQYGQKGR